MRESLAPLEYLPCWWKLPLLFLLGFACSTVLGVEVIDLQTLGGSFSTALDVNDHNQVICLARLPGDLNDHIALYEHGRLTDISDQYHLGTDGYTTWGNAINNRGQIAINTGTGTAAILSGFHVFDLGLGTYSTALDINNFGQVVGYYQVNGLERAFLYDHGNVFALGSVGPEAISYSNAINNNGVIVGFASDSYLTSGHAFVYSNGVTINLAPFGYSSSAAYDVNNIGQVVGAYWTGSVYRGFLYRNGSFTSIGSGPETAAYGINDHGQVVGYTAVSGVPHAFLWRNGVFTDLNNLLPSADWQLEFAWAINQHGAIAGQGKIHGQTHGFLFKP